MIRLFKPSVAFKYSYYNLHLFAICIMLAVRPVHPGLV